MKPCTILHASGAWLGRDRSSDADSAAERFAAFERLVDAALDVRPLALVFAGGLIDSAGLEAAEFDRLVSALERMRREALAFVLTPARAECLPHAMTQLSLLAARGLATVLAPHPEGRLDPAAAATAGAYVDLGSQLRVVGLGAPSPAARGELLARASVVAEANPCCVLVLAGAAPDADEQLDAFAYVALGGAEQHRALGARRVDPGPLAGAAAGATPGFLQVVLKTSGISAKPCPSGAPALELMEFDVSGMASLEELATRLKRKAPRSGSQRRILLRLTGNPGFDLDATPRAALARAAGKSLGGATVAVDLATDLKLASHALAVGAARADLESAALSALVARGGSERGVVRDLAVSCLGPLLEGTPEAIAEAMATIAAFEEARREG